MGGELDSQGAARCCGAAADVMRQRQHSHRSGSLIQPSNANSINNTHSQTKIKTGIRGRWRTNSLSPPTWRGQLSPSLLHLVTQLHPSPDSGRLVGPGNQLHPPSANQLLAAPWAGRTLRQRLGVIEQPLSGGRTVVNSDLLLRLHPFPVCGSKKPPAWGLGLSRRFSLQQKQFFPVW